MGKKRGRVVSGQAGVVKGWPLSIGEAGVCWYLLRVLEAGEAAREGTGIGAMERRVGLYEDMPLFLDLHGTSS